MVLLAAACAACSRPSPSPSPPLLTLERAAIQRDMQRLETAQRFDLAEAAEAYALGIVRNHPASPEAVALRARLPSLLAAAEMQRAQRVRAERWYYSAAEQGAHFQLRAQTFGEPEEAAPPVRLVIRRHPRFGQSAYLLIDIGDDFGCATDCTLPMTFDSQRRDFTVRRAFDNVPPALFLRDHEAFVAALEGGDSLRIEVPLASGKRTAYRFDIGGYQSGRMQGDGSPLPPVLQSCRVRCPEDCPAWCPAELVDPGFAAGEGMVSRSDVH